MQMTLFNDSYYNQILIGCGLVNILLVLFILVIRFQSIRKKIALLEIESSIAVLLIADGLSYAFDGVAGRAGFIIVRVSNFFVFSSIMCAVYFLCSYITALYMETGRFKRLPRRLLLGYILPGLGLVFLIVSQFTHNLYFIDSNNIFHRGNLYFWGIGTIYIAIILIFTFVIQYRTLIHKSLMWSVVLFSVLPLVSAVFQVIWDNFAFMDFAAWIASVALFWFALGDQNEELSKAASTEAASGLPNSYGYIYEVDRIIKFQDITQFNGFYFDIVRMGHMNNKYGKENGDEIICRYATYIKKTLDKDEILGRLGGNYFVALIKKSNTEKFLDLLKDVPVEIDFDGQNDVLHIAAVAGVYEIRNKNIVAGQILTHTSTAVSYAKNVVHKPYVFLDEKLEAEFERIRILEEEAKKALIANEFEPFYQPKIDSRDNVIYGAEALARWRHNDKLIPPFEFVPIMEKNSSVCKLDFYILDFVCRDLREWIDIGLTPVPISVNFSRKNLGNPNLANEISGIVEKYNIPSDLIQIEITETIDEYPMSVLMDVVHGIQQHGISVAIDDFGTGSSSIKLLKDIRFDVLKIDKSFVDYDNVQDKELLGDIIHMATSRNMNVIAEGVEEMSQVEALKEMGCYSIQGYVYDKPLEKSEFVKRIVR